MGGANTCLEVRPLTWEREGERDWISMHIPLWRHRGLTNGSTVSELIVGPHVRRLISSPSPAPPPVVLSSTQLLLHHLLVLLLILLFRPLAELVPLKSQSCASNYLGAESWRAGTSSRPRNYHAGVSCLVAVSMPPFELFSSFSFSSSSSSLSFSGH